MKVKDTKEFISTLKSFGITAYEEVEPTFFIGIFDQKRTALSVAVGDANVTIEGDKKLRQCVINVREGERVHELVSSIYTTRALAKKEMGRGVGFPLQLPRDSTTYEVVGKVTNVLNPISTGSNQRYEATVKATVKPTHMTFLVGYDEKHLFISALKHPRLTVASAHKELRPAGISTNAIRVGEWFFDPTNDEKTIGELNKLIANGDAACWETQHELEGFNHVVVLVADIGTRRMIDSESKKLYAAGVVYDVEGRHPPVMLPGWCRVVRNNELINDDLDRRFEMGGWD